MSEQDNRAALNLVVLCIEHAAEVDEPDRVAAFPADVLLEWKKEQLAEFDTLGKKWQLSDLEAAEVAAKSFVVAPMTISESIVQLGGEGGRAPGAGGGGGGAVGLGAVAGDGGAGGEIVVGTFLIADLPDTVESSLAKEVMVGPTAATGKMVAIHSSALYYMRRGAREARAAAPRRYARQSGWTRNFT